MSKESDQALVMMSIVAGSARVMIAGKAFAKVDLKKDLEDIYQTAAEGIVKWPGLVNSRWVFKKRKAFMTYVETLTKSDYPAIELTRMMERIVSDMQTMFPIGKKNALVNNMVRGVTSIVNHLDPEGKNFVAMEEAGNLLDVLYEILEIKDKQLA